MSTTIRFGDEGIPAIETDSFTNVELYSGKPSDDEPTVHPLDAATVAHKKLRDDARAVDLLERAAQRSPTTPLVDRRVLDDLVRLHEIAGHWSESARVRRKRLHFFTENQLVVHELRTLAQIDERLNVVATLHGTQQLDGTLGRDDGGYGFTLGYGSQETSLHIGRLIHPWRNAIGQQIQQYLFFPSRGILQQLNQTGNLFGIQWFRRDALSGTLGKVLTIAL